MCMIYGYNAHEIDGYWMLMRNANLNTDTLHHVQLASAVKVQNGLKLAGGPAVSIIMIIRGPGDKDDGGDLT